MNEDQKSTLEKFAHHIQQCSPYAIGIAYMILDCGCLQSGPFDEHGDQAGPVEHFLTHSSGDSIKICSKCVEDGGPPQRVRESGLIFFEPDTLSDLQKQWICSKIFCEALES